MSTFEKRSPGNDVSDIYKSLFAAGYEYLKTKGYKLQTYKAAYLPKKLILQIVGTKEGKNIVAMICTPHKNCGIVSYFWLKRYRILTLYFDEVFVIIPKIDCPSNDHLKRIATCIECDIDSERTRYLNEFVKTEPRFHRKYTAHRFEKKEKKS